jgi:hypothetical protein
VREAEEDELLEDNGIGGATYLARGRMSVAADEGGRVGAGMIEA